MRSNFSCALAYLLEVKLFGPGAGPPLGFPAVFPRQDDGFSDEQSQLERAKPIGRYYPLPASRYRGDVADWQGAEEKAGLNALFESKNNTREGVTERRSSPAW
jgi:hypothetical protein